MQLDASNAGSISEPANFCWLCVDENADRAGLHRKGVHNSPNGSRLDIARARWIKVKADHVCTDVGAGACVVRVCNAADFDLYRCRHIAVVITTAGRQCRKPALLACALVHLPPQR